jgi:predicted Zn-dependent protease
MSLFLPVRDSDPGLTGEMNPEWYFRSGVDLLDKDPKAARSAFARASALNPEEPRYTSYLGLSMVLSRTRGKEGVRLCERAIEQGYFHPDVCLNLGKAYLECGQRKKARATFLMGLRLDKKNRDLQQALATMGTRRPPVFPSLGRRHTLNRVAGRVLTRLGLR